MLGAGSPFFVSKFSNGYGGQISSKPLSFWKPPKGGQRHVNRATNAVAKYQAFWKAAPYLQDGRVFPTREPNVDPLAGPASLGFCPGPPRGGSQEKSKW